MQKLNFVILIIFLFSCAFINSTNLLKSKYDRYDGPCRITLIDNDDWWIFKSDKTLYDKEYKKFRGDLVNDVIKIYFENRSGYPCKCRIEVYPKFNFGGTPVIKEIDFKRYQHYTWHQGSQRWNLHSVKQSCTKTYKNRDSYFWKD